MAPEQENLGDVDLHVRSISADFAPRAQFSGPNVDVPSGASTGLPWAVWTSRHHDNVLDCTDPLNPKVVAAGVYAVTAYAFTGAPHAGKRWQLQLDLDVNGEDPLSPIVNGALDDPNGPGGEQSLVLSQTWFLPAGAVLNAAVQHNVGAALSVGLVASVQKVA